MSHAKVLNTKVVNVLSAEAPPLSDDSPGEWIATSYNTRGGEHFDPKTGALSQDQTKALRKNFAGVGYTYDAQRDAFFPPQPYPSWVLDEASCLWGAPVAMPNDGKIYSWDEDSASWAEEASA
jgi:hypothetical protein